MNELKTRHHYGVLTEPATLVIQRLLPGPILRVWAYLTDGNLRRRWLAAGEMEMEVGAPVELVWRNDELTDPPGERPSGSSGENRMQSRITELVHLRKLAIVWGIDGSVSFELTPEGQDVLLTLVHRGNPSQASLLNFSAGWHTHLDILAARLTDQQPEPFWDQIVGLTGEYDQRLPA